MGPTTILLVDDHVLFRKGMARLIDSQPDFDVVAEAEDGYQAVKYAQKYKPDLILMDVHMPECDGHEATRLIIKDWPQARIVMLTVSDDDKDLFVAIRNGALGYLVKKIEPEDLFARLRGVTQGEAPISRVMAGRILREFARLGTESPPPDSTRSLTPRERQVLQLVTKGMTNKEIGAQLHIAENTVKNHLRNILEKLHLHNRAQAAAYAVREGLVDNGRDN
jgi:two-component system, NarL family, nitrate/nitrite response regulator NarL